MIPCSHAEYEDEDSVMVESVLAFARMDAELQAEVNKKAQRG